MTRVPRVGEAVRLSGRALDWRRSSLRSDDLPIFCRDDEEDDDNTDDGDVVSGVSRASFSGTMWSRKATVQAGEAQGKQEMWETRGGTRGVGGVCKCWLICNFPSHTCVRKRVTNAIIICGVGEEGIDGPTRLTGPFSS